MKRIISLILVVSMLFSFASITFAMNDDRAEHREPNILYEDETKRNMYEKHFVCDDGTYFAATYPEQVCFMDDDGKWQEIDNSLSLEDGRYVTSNAQETVSFATISSDSKLVEVSNGKYDLSWNLSFVNDERFKAAEVVINSEDTVSLNEDVTADKNAAILSVDNIESNVTYESVFTDDVDLQYTVLPGRVKENIILNQRTDLPKYTMHVNCDNLLAKVTQDNEVVFIDALGVVQYKIQTPYMFDDIYELSYDILIELERTDDGYSVSFYPDQEWLNSEERIYPITIDPTVRTNTVKSNFSDTYIYTNSTASQSRALEERLRVGIYNSKVYRVLWKVETLPNIPQYAAISSATFKLKLPNATTTSRNFSLYKINSSWNSYTITWSQAASLSTTALESGVARNSSDNTLTFSSDNLRSAVRSWYTGTTCNGFLVRYTSESASNPDYNLFYSSDNTTSTSYMPVLTIGYSYGAAKSYRNVIGANVNCLGYAFELNEWIDITPSIEDTVHTLFFTMKQYMENAYGITVRKLNSNSRLKTNEYLVAMRFGCQTIDGELQCDYHFMVQLNNGNWAHKFSSFPSENLGAINPNTYNWNLYNANGTIKYVNFYDSDTLYFAVG